MVHTSWKRVLTRRRPGDAPNKSPNKSQGVVDITGSDDDNSDGEAEADKAEAAAEAEVEAKRDEALSPSQRK